MEDGFLTRDMSGYQLGIELSAPPESIDDAAAVILSNCEYSADDGSLQTVPGIRILYEAAANEEISSLHYNQVRKEYYFTIGGKMYATSDFKTNGYIGTLSGADTVHYAMYGATCIVASGSTLQYISNDGKLLEVTGSPASTNITVRNGRLVSYHKDSDKLSYSAIGDYTQWANVPNDASSAQEVNIGYKDPGHIIAVDFLSKVLLVYKEDGRAYKVVGEPGDNDFAVEPVSQTAFCMNSDAVLNIDSKAYYLGSSGLQSFIPSNAYGDIAPFDEGLSVNSALMNNMDSNCNMWHIPSKKQIWIKTQTDSAIYIYHYIPRHSDGRGVFTTRSLQHDLSSVCDNGKHVYIAYGNKIGMLDSTLDTDDGKQIVTHILGANRLAPEHFILVMKCLLVTHNMIPGHGTIRVGRKAKKVEFPSDNLSADADMTTLDTATRDIVTDNYTRSFRVGGGSNRNVQPEIIVEKGAVSIRQFHYKYLEV